LEIKKKKEKILTEKKRKKERRYLQEYLLVSHPYVRSRVYADTAKPLLQKNK
jgi:hypothetical protein